MKSPVLLLGRRWNGDSQGRSLVLCGRGVYPKAVRTLFPSGYALKMCALGSKAKGEAMSEKAER